MKAKAILAAAIVMAGGIGVAGTAGAGAPGPAPGKAIQEACGVSFGQLVGPAKKAGTSFHSNYAGGAKALVPLAAAHGCG
jgi:hypothetical protein